MTSTDARTLVILQAYPRGSGRMSPSLEVPLEATRLPLLLWHSGISGLGCKLPKYLGNDASFIPTEINPLIETVMKVVCSLKWQKIISFEVILINPIQQLTTYNLLWNTLLKHMYIFIYTLVANFLKVSQFWPVVCTYGYMKLTTE